MSRETAAKQFFGAIVCILAVLAVFLFAMRRPIIANLCASKSRSDQMLEIAAAVRYYNMRLESPPTGLSNLVAAGLLPESSSVYAASVVKLKLNPTPVHFEQSDYEIVPGTNGTIVRLKPELLQNVKSTHPKVRDSFFSIFVGNDEEIIFTEH